MFALITGKLASKSVNEVIVDVGGIGYRVFIPLSSFYELPDAGGDVTFHLHTHVKEDAIHLFGFRTVEEKTIFQLMVQVSGIGPKLAINVLSGISALELVKAIANGDLARLVTIPGIGRKTAERIVFELKEKFSKLASMEAPGSAPCGAPGDILREDALSALVNLGYKLPAANHALDRALENPDEGITLEGLLKRSLKYLSS